MLTQETDRIYSYQCNFNELYMQYQCFKMRWEARSADGPVSKKFISALRGRNAANYTSVGSESKGDLLRVNSVSPPVTELFFCRLLSAICFRDVLHHPKIEKMPTNVFKIG